MIKLLAAALLGLLVACGASDRREPPPLVVIEVLDYDYYRIDGAEVGRAELERRLTDIAAEHRRPVVYNSRVYVHIIPAGTGTGGETQRLASWCTQQGLDKIRIGR